MFFDSQAMLGQYLMQHLPAIGAFDATQAFAFDPTGQAFNARFALNILDGSICRVKTGFMVDLDQSVCLFDLFTNFGNNLVIVIWIMDCQFSGMNLVDRNMNMQVISVFMHNTDALVF